MKFLRNLFKKHRQRRVVITGLGVVSPVGIGKEEFWKQLLQSQTGIGKITRFDASSFPSQIAAEVRNFSPETFMSEKQVKNFGRSTQFALAAAKLAKQDSGIELFDPFRTDIIIGSGVNSFEFVDEQVFANPTAGRAYIPGTFDSFGIAKYNINSPACVIAAEERIQGFVCTVATACASGLTSVGSALARIRDNYADVVIAGGTDSGVNHFTLNLFSSAGFLNTNNENPEEALCPFDLRRTHSVLGEGAGIFILEEYSHALARGAQIYAEVVGFHQEYENVDELCRGDKSGNKWAETLSLSLPSDGKKVNYINAHGTSDVVLDAIESKAIQMALGSEAARHIPTSSIKGNIGSPFAAAGALQVVATSLAIKNKRVPPSYNYKVYDPQCDLQVAHKAKRRSDLHQALVSGHGFGGVNVAVVLREVA